MALKKCTECGELRRLYRNDRHTICPPIQLELSRRARLRRRLRSLIDSSGLPIVVFAEWVLGRDPRTLQRWLAGEKIPDSAAVWIDRLELAQLNGGQLILSLRWQERRPRWRYFQAQKNRILYQSGEVVGHKS